MTCYTNQECTDKHLLCGQAFRAAVVPTAISEEALFAPYSLRHHRSTTTGDGDLLPSTAWCKEMALYILQMEEPYCCDLLISRRQVQEQLLLNTMFCTWRSGILHTANLYLFHIQKVQLLTEDHYHRHEEIVRWIFNNITHSNPQFSATVLFTDETSFTKEGFANTLNAHMWAIDNPHAIVSWKSQQKFRINVWARIHTDYLLGSYKNVPAAVQRDMWFMHDGVPAPGASILVHNHLDVIYTRR